MSAMGTVKLSRICPFCGRILLDQRLRINDLAVAAGGENAAKLLNLTVPPEKLRKLRDEANEQRSQTGKQQRKGGDIGIWRSGVITIYVCRKVGYDDVR